MPQPPPGHWESAFKDSKGQGVGGGQLCCRQAWPLGDSVLKLTFYHLGDLTDSSMLHTQVKGNPESTHHAVPNSVTWLPGTPRIIVVQLLSHVWLCNPMDWSMPGFPVLHYLPEFAQTPVHLVGDAIQPSHPLSPPSPFAFTPSIGSFPMSWKNTRDSLWVIPTSAREKPTWHIWVTLGTLLENVDREFPGGLVVRIPGFRCFGLGHSLVRELRFCKSHSTAKKKKMQAGKRFGAWNVLISATLLNWSWQPQVLHPPGPGSNEGLLSLERACQVAQWWRIHLASARDTRDSGSLSGLGRSPGEGNGSPLKYSCLGNLVDRGAWWATFHGVAESDMTEWPNNKRQQGSKTTQRGHPGFWPPSVYPGLLQAPVLFSFPKDCHDCFYPSEPLGCLPPEPLPPTPSPRDPQP